MVGSSWSSSSSCTSSFGSLDEDLLCVVKSDSAAPEGCVKFLCSYGGRILPRHTDGALRYVGGHNRVLSVDRSLHFYELQRKLREMCGGWDVSLRCQLPTEDLDALVSVTGDDDLANLLEEYDAASRDRLEPLKIRAFLFPTRTPAVVPPSLPPTSPRSTTTNKKTSPRESTTNVHHHHLHRKNSSPGTAARVSTTTSASSQWWAGPQPQASLIRSSARAATVAQARPHRYLVHNGSHWQ